MSLEQILNSSMHVKVGDNSLIYEQVHNLGQSSRKVQDLDETLT